MSIEFYCPKCYTLIITPEETAGKQGRCPNCSTIIPIPSQSQPQRPASDSAGTQAAAPTPMIHPATPQRPGDPFKPSVKKQSVHSETVEKQFGFDPDEPPSSRKDSWGEDTEMSYRLRKVVAREHAQSRLVGPAQSMIVTAAINLFLVILAIAGLVFYVIYYSQSEVESQSLLITLWILGIAVVLLDSTMIMVGGNHMKHCRSYSMAYTGAIFAMLPLNLLFFLTIPIGVWALTTLNDPELAEGFKRN